ncbi:MAG: MFS transporter [Dorea sp.]|nr:MFS transporter [Dorea sp.]
MKRMENRNVLLLIVILSCANTAVYGLPYMKGQFYDIMLEALRLNHTQLSTLFSIYGFVSLGAYLLGGILADMASLKKIMCAALMISGAMHMYAVTIPGYYSLCVIFALLAFTSVMAFYPASMKILSGLRLHNGNGMVFGIYVALINVVGILVVSGGLLVLRNVNDSIFVFQTVSGLYGMMHFVVLLLLILFFKEENTEHREKSGFINMEMLKYVLRDFRVWGIVGIVFFNYMLQSILTYVIPYFSQVYRMNEETILVISIFRVNIITILVSPLAGKIADKCGSAVRLIEYTFILTVIFGIVLLGSLFFAIPIGAAVAVVLIITVAATAGKSMNMVTISEMGIPEELKGTVIGVVAFLGYSPDAFFYSIAGGLLDQCQLTGYKIIFGIFLLCAVMGTFICRRLRAGTMRSKML